MRRVLPRATYANVMATIAVFVALGGTAFAAATITGASVKNRSLTGADIKRNSLSSVEIKNGSLGTADLSAKARTALKGATGATGAAGATGATGATGPVGPTGVTNVRWASVTSAGVIARSTGGISNIAFVTPNAGEKALDFGSSVAACSYQVTLGASAPGADPVGYGTAQPRLNGNPNHLAVELYNKDGDSTASAYHIAVFC